jgi:hypothetical protein
METLAMHPQTDGEKGRSRGANALALDPYSPVVHMPDGTDSAADPLGLDPYSPIVGRSYRAGQERAGAEGR